LTRLARCMKSDFNIEKPFGSVNAREMSAWSRRHDSWAPYFPNG
jgi:hypothetical protein